MTYKVYFHPLAEQELFELDGSVRILVLKQIKKISEYPEIGEDLGNKHGFDLSGYKKMYANNKKIRIVYSINNNEIYINIIAIGKREDFEVYKDASNRT